MGVRLLKCTGLLSSYLLSTSTATLSRRGIMWATDGVICISCIPRCGSHSITKALPGNSLSHREASRYTQRVGLIRHPFTRLASAYSLFAAHYEGWEPFVDSALASRNVHWNPQVDLLSLEGEYIPTISYRFEDINKVWPLHFSSPLEHLNSTPRKEVTNYRMKDIERYYEKDLALWNELT